MKASYIVTLNIPVSLTKNKLRDYIAYAITTMCGSYPPFHPIFHLERKSVKVKYKPLKKRIKLKTYF